MSIENIILILTTLGSFLKKLKGIISAVISAMLKRSRDWKIAVWLPDLSYILSFPPKTKSSRDRLVLLFAPYNFHLFSQKMGNESSVPHSYGTRLLNDINIDWKKVELDVNLPSRDGHCAATVENKLYIFGGVRWLSDIGEVTESNEILLFDAGK